MRLGPIVLASGAIERFNRTIKFQGGNRIELRLEDFCRNVLIISNTSMRLDPNNYGYTCD